MLEIELKAFVDTEFFQDLEKKILAQNFYFVQMLEESDHYFNAPDRNFAESDEALRIREQRSGLSEQTMLTYKGAKVDPLSNTRVEIETKISNAADMQRILNSLGYKSVLTVEKKRREFRGTAEFSQVNICLDQLAGLGSFIEIEYCAESDISQKEGESIRDRLLSLLDLLGIPRANLTRKSYLELLIERATS
ncbi:MAG: class IV adenylate cyclase [Clostridiaceae bacterium]|jgi:adenylate cyclase class 2|nr:class IV adenylate cyclase [Clostridiaceae bacterium]